MEEQRYYRVQMIALVFLRVMIGWHFLYEGVAKFLKPHWSAAGYLMQSRGLFAPLFHWIADVPGVLTVVNQMNIWGLMAIGLGLIFGFLTPIAAVGGLLLNVTYFVLMIHDWAEQGQNLMMALVEVVVLGTHAWQRWSLDNALGLFV